MPSLYVDRGFLDVVETHRRRLQDEHDEDYVPPKDALYTMLDAEFQQRVDNRREARPA